MDNRHQAVTDRRTLLKGAATASALLAPGVSFAAGQAEMTKVKAAIAAGHDAAVKRLQDWIALPSIAAENRNMAEGAAYMAKLGDQPNYEEVIALARQLAESRQDRAA